MSDEKLFPLAIQFHPSGALPKGGCPTLQIPIFGSIMVRLLSRLSSLFIFASAWTIVSYRDSWMGFAASVAGTKQSKENSVGSDMSSPQIQQNKPSHSTFIIAAGRGTTGTHGMFKATCRMGYPSIHWSVHCLDQERHNATTAATNSQLKVMSLMKMAERCIAGSNTTTCGSAQRWKQDILRAMSDLVTSDGLRALHDSPYPAFLPEFLPMLQRSFQNVVIILSERDPLQYVNRRSEKHYGRDDIVCRSEHAVPFVPANLQGGLLDLGGCIDRATKEADVDLRDVFLSLGDQVETIDGRTKLVQAVAEWQMAVRDKAAYSVDLFARPNKTMPRALVQEMRVHGIPRIHGARSSSEFMNAPALYELYDKVAMEWGNEEAK